MKAFIAYAQDSIIKQFLMGNGFTSQSRETSQNILTRINKIIIYKKLYKINKTIKLIQIKI